MPLNSGSLVFRKLKPLRRNLIRPIQSGRQPLVAVIVLDRDPNTALISTRPPLNVGIALMLTLTETPLPINAAQTGVGRT